MVVVVVVLLLVMVMLHQKGSWEESYGPHLWQPVISKQMPSFDYFASLTLPFIPYPLFILCHDSSTSSDSGMTDAAVDRKTGIVYSNPQLSDRPRRPLLHPRLTLRNGLELSNNVSSEKTKAQACD